MNSGARATRGVIVALALAAGVAPACAQGLGGPAPAGFHGGAAAQGIEILRGRVQAGGVPAAAFEPRHVQLAATRANADVQAQADAAASEYRAALACITSGTVATSVALAVGGENLLHLIAGGLVPAHNPVALYLALVGVVFGAYCSIGQSLVPIYVHYAEPPPAVPVRHAPDARDRPAAAQPAPSRSPAGQAGVLGGVATRAAQRIDAGPFAIRPAPDTILVAQQPESAPR